MNAFDAGILHGLNVLARKSYLLDRLVVEMEGSVLVKGLPFMAAMWWLWFSAEKRRERRETTATAVAAACAAVVAGRLLALGLPFRPRPMLDADLKLVMPYGMLMDDHPLRAWSAFPSDHAMVYSALATALWAVSPALGAAAHLYWIVVIGLPRLYLGLHHPTDVLAGAALGAAIAWALTRPAVRASVARPLLSWHDRHEPSFYAAAFLFTTQMAVMFDPERRILSALVRFLRHG